MRRADVYLWLMVLWMMTVFPLSPGQLLLHVLTLD